MDSFQNLDILIDLALEEDLQDNGDITSESIFSNEKHVFKLMSKDKGVLCGIDVFIMAIHRIDSKVIITKNFSDGNIIDKGDIIAKVSGSVLSILRAERTSLNFISLLSAIATKTSKFVKEANGRLIILDTRKTIPGFRQLQKYAVRCGGGSNHRMGLYDMVMIKDNHIDASGGISAAVEKVRKKWDNRFKIAVETRSLAEVEEALACRVNRIMLDNMTENEMIEAVKIIGDICETEATGNISLERIQNVAQTGVNFVSSGELTHSVKAFDFTLRE